MKRLRHFPRLLAGIVLAALPLAVPASADPEPGQALKLTLDEKPINRVTVPTPTSFAPMLKTARKSVVAVHTAEVVRIVRSSAGTVEDEILRRFFGLPSPRRAPTERDIELEVGDRNQGVGGVAGALLEGIGVEPLTKKQRGQLRLRESVTGLVVTSADPASPSARYLPEGLVILEINDRPAPSVVAAREALRDGINKLYVYSRGRTGYLALRLP